MTGKLQTLMNANFFLSIVSTAFDASHINFQCSINRFCKIPTVLKMDVNILKNTASCNAFAKQFLY